MQSPDDHKESRMERFQDESKVVGLESEGYETTWVVSRLPS